jgi:hypothetical protein
MTGLFLSCSVVYAIKTGTLQRFSRSLQLGRNWLKKGLQPEGAQMMVFWHERLVLLATPKTGSTALMAALRPRAHIVFDRPPEAKHTPGYRYQRFIKPYVQNTAGGVPFEAFAQMREPIDWLRSWYRFRQRADVLGPHRSTADMTFADFVRAYMTDPRPPFADVGQQSRFLSGKDGAPRGVEHIFRYETPAQILGFIETRLGLRLELARMNPSPPAETPLPDALEADLRAYLAKDYAIYDAL